MLARLNPKTRAVLVTAVGAAIGAVFADHFLKPGLKRRLGV